MKLKINKYKDYLFYLALFLLIQLWTIPHTIAARYVCEGVLFILIFSSRLEWNLILGKSKLLVIFCLLANSTIFLFN